MKKEICGTEITLDDIADIRVYNDIVELACRDCPEAKDKYGESKRCGEYLGEERCDRIPSFYKQLGRFLR